MKKEYSPKYMKRRKFWIPNDEKFRLYIDVKDRKATDYGFSDVIEDEDSIDEWQ